MLLIRPQPTTPILMCRTELPFFQANQTTLHECSTGTLQSRLQSRCCCFRADVHESHQPLCARSWLVGTLAYTQHQPVGYHARRAPPMVITHVASGRCTAPNAMDQLIASYSMSRWMSNRRTHPCRWQSWQRRLVGTLPVGTCLLPLLQATTHPTGLSLARRDAETKPPSTSQSCLSRGMPSRRLLHASRCLPAYPVRYGIVCSEFSRPRRCT